MNWWRRLQGRVKFQEPLKKHTSFKIGGRVRFFVEPKNINDIKILLKNAKRYNLRTFIIGSGSNILASNKRINAIAIHLDSDYFKRVSHNSNCLNAGSGLKLSQLIQKAKYYNLSGAEFLAGIPGTLGGALAMNAGAWGRSIGSLVEDVTVMDYNGNMKTLYNKDIKFQYRKSNLAKYIILSACIRLHREKREVIQKNIKQYLKKRHKLFNNSHPNAGCIFMNPSDKISAGYLIESCGLKNKRTGNVCISGKHANFILNLGEASFRDVLNLMALAKKAVKRNFGINLKPEIKIWR